MDDFEDRLRNELAEAAAPLGPTPGLRSKVDRRVRHHRRVRRARVVISVAGVLLVMVGVGVFLESDDRGNENTVIASPSSTMLVNDHGDAPVPCGEGPFADPSLWEVPEVSARYVGLDEQVARAQAGAEDRVVRVICRDGVSLPMKLDLETGRINLHVVGGEVVAVRVEGQTLAAATDPASAVAVP